jgi:hypothetical protein
MLLGVDQSAVSGEGGWEGMGVVPAIEGQER